MKFRSPVLLILAFALCMVVFSTPAFADEPEFSAVAKHLREHYHATERHIPFIGLAYFAVKLVRPAGVKSVKVKIYENLNYTHNGVDDELHSALQHSLGPNWQPLVRVYSRKDGEQTFVYSKQEGKCMRLMVVIVEREQATIVKVKINPDALLKFMDNPKIMGISLGGPIR